MELDLAKNWDELAPNRPLLWVFKGLNSDELLVLVCTNDNKVVVYEGNGIRMEPNPNMNVSCKPGADKDDVTLLIHDEAGQVMEKLHVGAGTSVITIPGSPMLWERLKVHDYTFESRDRNGDTYLRVMTR